MKQNNKKFNNAMHKFVGVLDKYEQFQSKDALFLFLEGNIYAERAWEFYTYDTKC